MNDFRCVAPDVRLGEGVKLAQFVNLYGCEIGDHTKLGTFVEIQKNARIGSKCKISSHTFVCEGVTIEDNVFIGHGVVFVNDRFPRATTAQGQLQTEADWSVEPTTVKRGASIGSGARILSKVTIGENALIGAGSVVTRDVPANTVVAGNPARVLRVLPAPQGEPVMSDNTNIPFLDLVTPHQELKAELTQVFASALETGAFIGGPVVEEFERNFAAFCDAAHCVGVGSGTDALRFALLACGVGEGDSVITVPHTFIATTEAISQAGARPLFVDIDSATYNMDPVKLREYVETQCDRRAGRLIDRKSGRRVAAVVPVHIYGQTADMDPILELAEEYGLTVIEDACQAHGAEYFSRKENCWRKAGSMGKAAAFSFYPGKNLGTCGEAGAVTTNDPDLAQHIRMLRDHGQSTKYYHDIEGYNGRLDSIQAGILGVKLRHLAAWTTQRRKAAQVYRELFASAGASIVLPYEPPWAKAVYHLFVIRVADRAQLQKSLADAHIGTGVHYPIPLHLQKAYQDLGYGPDDFPVTEKAALEIVSLPMFPGLRPEQQERVAQRVLEFAECARV